MLARKASLVLLFFMRSRMSSVISMSSIGFNTLRKIQIFWSSLSVKRSSSLRVPDFLMLIAGKRRRSANLRSRLISLLPVPLNSSKITSSILEPVSIQAVEIIVNDPPSSTLRAAPKKRFGLNNAFESTPPERTLPLV